MQKSIEELRGDTEGVVYQIPVYRFSGSSSGAPTAYIQAALHAGELPGVVAIHALMPKLRKAEAEGRILGNLAVVPAANPVGRAQYLFGDLEGRFHLGTRTNFNRGFPLLGAPNPSALPSPDLPSTIDERLKRKLIELSMGHDIVLDLHCDDEGVAYLYVPAELWPAMADCAAAMGVEAVITWAGSSGSSFDEASLYPWMQIPEADARLEHRVVTTVEYRGIRDVESAFAESDAEGLYRLLVARGVIEDASVERPSAFSGVVRSIDHVEMISAPRAGAILFHVEPGDRVRSGDHVATVIHAPGEEDGSVDVFAPQAGYVLTRSSRRSARAGDNLIKLVGDAQSAAAKQGALED